MLKIEDVHTCDDPNGEYVVLQNHGLNTISLRGWALCGDAYLSNEPSSLSREMFVFSEDIPVKPYTRIVLFTGDGDDEWRPTTDGKHAYLVYWRKSFPVWRYVDRIFLLQPTSTRKVNPIAVDLPVASRF